MQVTFGSMVTSGALLILVLISIISAYALHVESKLPNIPKYIKLSYLYYGIIAWNRTGVILYWDPRWNKRIKFEDWDWGILSVDRRLNVGDLILIKAKRRQIIALMIVAYNGTNRKGRYVYETAYIGNIKKVEESKYGK